MKLIKAETLIEAVDSDDYVDGSIDTAHIGDDQVTYAKIQNVSATDRILGRDTSGAGVIEEITPANLRAMINVEDGSTADQTKSDIDGLAITTVGTIDTGVWQGTAVATNQQKHLQTFELKGYSTHDGTNYEIPMIMTDTNAPFEHNESTGSAGTTAIDVSKLLRAAGQVMPYAGTVKKWKGWAAGSGSGTTYIALFKYTPDNSVTSDSLVLIDAASFSVAGNNTVVAFDETSFTDADKAAGDIIITGMKGVSSKTTYFTSTMEIEWD